MEFVGRLIQVLPETSGTSRAGNPWKKKSWVAETFGQYPRKVKMDAMNGAADALFMEPGKVYSFSVDLESREYNDRWYTDVRVFRAVETVDPTMQGVGQPPVGNTGGVTPPPAPVNPFASNDPFGTPATTGGPGAAFAEDSSDDLPF